MATMAGAFTALATFAGTVTGIKNSYDLNAAPESLGRDALPCALIIPENGQEIGFKTLTYMGNAPILTFSCKQVLLYQASDNQPFRKVVPGLIALIDAYFQALKAAPFLVTLNPGVTAPIHQPIRIKPWIGILKYAEVNYHGVELSCDLEIYL